MSTNPAIIYEEIFDSVPSGIVIIDGHGKVIQVNKVGEKLLGDSLIGRSWLSVIREQFCLKADDGHEISLKSGKKVQVSTTPLNSVQGQLIQITDLTETRALQDKLRQMEKLSNLGRMAATLAHQIRTPLSAAMLYAANIGNNNLSTEDKNNFQKKLMERLQDLESQISDVLLFARSGDNIVEKVEFSSLINDIVDNANVIFDNNGAELTVQMDDPPLTIIANSSALKGAISNLLNNALQANATHVLLQVLNKNENIELRIVDNGDGIDEKHLSTIFEPFFTTKSCGTGLGLAVVKAVVNAHHGNVKVASVVKEGTCFTLTFPKCAMSKSQRKVG